MKRFCWIALWLAAATLAMAQQREMRAGYVYPAGGQAGTSFEVLVGGQNLNNITNAFVSGPGVQTYVVPQEPLINFRQADDLRMRLQELRRKGNAADVLKEVNDIRKKLAAFERRRNNPTLGDQVIVKVFIAPNAAPGNRELRLASYGTLSNPLVFQVGTLPEVRESEAKIDDNIIARRNREGRAATNTAAIAVTLPTTVNGQIMPGAVDSYRFKATKGQQLVVMVSARELIPYLADAVPGWIQAKIVLRDGRGKELVYNDDYRFHPDPVLLYTIPKDDDYVLEISDSLYRGREDFVYRVSIGELPFITNVYPLGARVGSQPTVFISGWNLASDRYTLNLTGVEPGLYPFALPDKKGHLSNHVAFMVDTVPEIFKKSPSNHATNAQYLTLPVIINGHIDNPGDVDVFRFDGRAGDKIVAEVHARRLDSPVDSALKLTDATGKQIAYNDDHEDKGSGLNTHHADSYISATLPTSGPYYLYLWDNQQKGGWAYSYRLRVSAPRPDFELRAVPSSVSARPGGSASINVFALRRDGFTNAINVALKNPPEGFKLSTGSLVATQEQIKLSLSIPSKAPKTAVSLQLEGRASVLGRDVVHRAVPADDMMQAFAYRHLVPANELKVLVASPAPPRPPEPKPATTPATPAGTSLKIPSGGTASIHLKLPTTTYTGKLHLDFEEATEGISIKSFTPARDGVDIVLQTAAAKVKPGQKGELIVLAFAERTNVKPADGKPRTRLGALPAVRYEIVAK